MQACADGTQKCPAWWVQSAGLSSGLQRGPGHSRAATQRRIVLTRCRQGALICGAFILCPRWPQVEFRHRTNHPAKACSRWQSGDGHFDPGFTFAPPFGAEGSQLNGMPRTFFSSSGVSVPRHWHVCGSARYHPSSLILLSLSLSPQQPPRRILDSLLSSEFSSGFNCACPHSPPTSPYHPSRYHPILEPSTLSWSLNLFLIRQKRMRE